MTKVTVKELREHAKAAGLKGYSRMTKSELEAAIKKAESRRYVAEQREKKGSQWQPETSKEFNRALYGCETYGEVDSLVSEALTAELNAEHRKSQAPEYRRTEYVKFFAGLKGIRVEGEAQESCRRPLTEAKAKTSCMQIRTKRRRTTLEIVESLKSARNHAERLDMLRRAGIGQLKKIGKIEMMAEFGRGWTVETLSERILAQLENRYAKIDGGGTVYMCGIFGMPIALETPLLKARREKRKRGEELDVIEIEKESAEEEGQEFQAGKKYKEEYSGAIATIKHRAYDMVSLELNYQGQKMPMQLRARMVDGREEIKASLDYVDKKGCWKRMKISLKASDIVTAGAKTGESGN